MLGLATASEIDCSTRLKHYQLPFLNYQFTRHVLHRHLHSPRIWRNGDIHSADTHQRKSSQAGKKNHHHAEDRVWVGGIDGDLWDLSIFNLINNFFGPKSF